MKSIYFISGTMGVGKTATSLALKKKLPNSVFLDGDWCWDMHPFQVTPETKRMVLENICFLLNNFLKCSVYEHIIFCWVMPEQWIIDHILSALDTKDCRIHLFSLVCSEESLRQRINKDIDTGLRTEDVSERSNAYLPLYDNLNTVKVDVSDIDPEQVAELILRLSRE
ncbi:MAG: AAA family ATPase [Acholeplasmataceae bacterium]|nr:AAA family ATPase [Acholeplasmataceae bacterium]